MAENIKIQLDDIYEPVTEKDIKTGKNFVLRRESVSNTLGSLVDALMEDAAESIVQICYKYNIDPTSFTLSAEYNEEMFKKVAEVMDQLEEDIMELIEYYSTNCTKDKEKKSLLLLWILTLGRDNMSLQATLHQRLMVFMKDLEAMIAVAKTAKFETTKVVSLIKSYLHTVYQMPGMTAAFRNASLYKARYIRTKGVKKGNVGNSNSEANNIIRFARLTQQMAWMRYHRQMYDERGAAGYYVLRGSNYPCDLCDSRTGFHTIDEVDAFPPQHYNCVCYTIPIFEKDINDLTE